MQKMKMSIYLLPSGLTPRPHCVAWLVVANDGAGAGWFDSVGGSKPELVGGELL